ncbi:MAG: transposase [Thermoleophilia bacterium]|nr:transposase [Thermoleophilia bacterium]
MPQARVPMRKVREVLRLHSLGLNNTQIAGATSIARSTIRDCLKRARDADVIWPIPGDVDDDELERLLYGERVRVQPGRVAPDFARVKRELAGKGVTLQLVHAEYVDQVGVGAYSYSRFCELFRSFEASTAQPSMRQRHCAGERLFVDWAGMTVPIIDRASGEVIDAQIFVGTLGASSYTFVRAYRSQSQRDWLAAHVAMFDALGGVPQIVVPDNTKTAITKPNRYDPDVNIAYADLAQHYGVAVIPARVRRPRDKSKVEVAVQVVERHVLAPLRKQTFFGIDELNAAMQPLIDAVNDRVMSDYDASRRTLFATIDQPALRALPPGRYEYAEWSRAKAGPDYHVAVDKHHYSVPYRLIGRQLEVRQTARSIEVFDRGERVAAHVRSFVRGAHTTSPSDMPSSHRRHAEWTPQRLTRWAGEAGPSTARAVAQIMADKPHPEQGFRSALGVISLGKRHGVDRLEAACARAVAVGAVQYRSIKSILERGLDRQPLPDTGCVIAMPRHPNIRGGSYFTPRPATPTTTKDHGC